MKIFREKQPLNNQQLTDYVIDRELMIVKLETKKKKLSKITIADVMKTLVVISSICWQAINKINNQFIKLENSVEKQLNSLNNWVGKIENEIFNLWPMDLILWFFLI